MLKRLLLFVVLLGVLVPTVSWAQVNVLTQHNDINRTGANPNETILTTANVNVASFGKLFSRAVDGQIYAQPLYVQNVSIPDADVHNVVYVCTEHDSVYAFDADDPTASTPLWQVNLGPSAPTSAVGGDHIGIFNEVGILSTPVIDLQAGTIYAVAQTYEDGIVRFRLHALDITTGAERPNSPAIVEGIVPGTGPDSVNGVVSFAAEDQLQRPGLLLLNGNVYFGFGSHEDLDPYHGWVFGFDAVTLQQTAIRSLSPDGGSGVWQGGNGLAAETSGNIYVATGRGAFDGVTNFGESLVKLNASDSLGVVDFFSPSNQANLGLLDVDLGAGGPVLMPGTSLGVVGGKEGKFFVFDTGNLGQFHSTDQVHQEWQATFSLLTTGDGGFFGGPVYFNSTLYAWGRRDFLNAFAFDGSAFNTTPASQSTTTVADGYANEPAMSLSSNGTNPGTAILWASHSVSGGSNGKNFPGILHAFDASDVSKELWNSNQDLTRDNSLSWAKWSAPTIANGKVYLATFDNALVVYGLLDTQSAPPGPISVQLTAPVSASIYTSPAAISLGATATSSAGAIDHVDFYAGATLIGTVPSSPYAVTWNVQTLGPFELTAVATDSTGGIAVSAPVQIALTSGAPDPWDSKNVGAVGAWGNGLGDGSSFTVAGSGADIWNSADAFQFMYRPLTGDGQIVAHVASLQNTDGWAKAGVMIRETIGAGARYGALFVTPGNGLAFQRRLQADGASSYTGAVGAAPAWLKLARVGNTITAYASTDGVGWVLVGSDTLPLGPTVLVGLAVTSHRNDTLNSATFDQVSVGDVDQGVTLTPVNVPPTVTLTSPFPGSAFGAPANLTIAADANDSDGTVVGVDFFAGTTLIGTATTAPYTVTWTTATLGSYTFTAVATDDAGASTTSAGVTITVRPPPNTTLPAPWLAQDVGVVGVPGSASGDGSSFTATGSGADIWSTADAFQYVYQPLAGDGQIVARVTSVQNTDPWAKAGVMIREDLSAGARYGALFVTPGNGVAFQRRLQANEASLYSGDSGAAPTWLKITRSGATVAAYRSPDGVAWTLVGNDVLPFGPTVFVGLAVTSHHDNTLNNSAFDQVTVGDVDAPPPGGPPDVAPTVAITSPVPGKAVPAPAAVPVAVTADDTDGSVARVDFYVDGTLFASDSSTPYGATFTSGALGTHTLTAIATDNLGVSTTSTPVTITVTAPTDATVPSPWAAQDIGAVGAVGGTAGDGTAFAVAGSGADIWGGADAFQFVYQPFTGDGQIVARVTSVQNTDPWAKAGVMIREDLSPGARYGALFVTPGNGVAFQRRLQVGQTSTYTGAAGAAPQWVKIVRSGATVSAFDSSDGVSWTLVDSDTLAFGPTVFFGLVVTSHQTKVLNTSVFDQVAVGDIDPSGGPPPGGPADAAPAVTIDSPTAGLSVDAPASVTISVTATDSDGSIARVDFYVDATLIGSDTSSPYNVTWGVGTPGSYTLTAVATDNLGVSTTSDGVVVTVTTPADVTIPSPWTAPDIGAVGVPGSSASADGTSFVVGGSGADIWDTQDAFRYVYQPLSGDGQIVAQVTSLQNTDPWAKAGVMIREDLSPGARYAALLVTPSNGLAFQRRLLAGKSSVYTAATGSAPGWIKLVRSGSTMSAFRSDDGVGWTLVGTDTLPVGANVYIGLAVTSHNNKAITIAAFDSVTLP